MRHLNRIFLSFIICFLMSLSAWSQVLEQNVVREESRWSGFTLASYTTNAKKDDVYDQFSQFNTNTFIDYKLGGGHQLRTSVGFNKRFWGEEETFLNDSFIGWRKATPVGKLFIIQDVRLGVPLSQQSVDNAGLRTSISYRPLIVYGLGDLGLKGVSLIYIPVFTRNFHRFETTKTGIFNFNAPAMSNNRYSLTHIALLEFSLSNRWRGNFGGTYMQGWTYQGNRNNDLYSVFQEIGYRVTPKLTVNIGHSNFGSIYQANGIDSNVRLFSDVSSTYYLSMMMMFK